MDIREARLDDVPAIDTLHREAFGGEHGERVAALVLDLRKAARKDDGLSLVAETEGAVVGHVTFSRGLLDTPTRLLDVQILSPVAVTPAKRREGIAAELIRRGLESLTTSGVPAVFLEGDPGYYSRLGFVRAGPLGFRKPSLRIPDAAFQVKTLAAYEPWMTGTLVYPDAFWRNDAVGLRDHEYPPRKRRSPGVWPGAGKAGARTLRPPVLARVIRSEPIGPGREQEHKRTPRERASAARGAVQIRDRACSAR